MMKCLIVDDAAFVRMSLKQIFQSNGLFDEVVEASNGLEAIEAYKREQPDIVTMDVTMPEMDGLTAIKHIIEIDPKAKILVCSAMGQKDIVLEAIQAGAKNFIVKPYEGSKVVEVVKAVLGK
ncbi:MAG TPA: response regulator [Bacillota bacterium]|nr:response regulator [Bacillota bacterium]HPT86792.1 response regulator [Bacillota bacterium]